MDSPGVTMVSDRVPRILRTSGWAVLILAVVTGIWLLSRWNYLVFHSAAEIFSIVTAVVIFLAAWSARRMATNGFLTVLGAGMPALAAILLLHLLVYKGMNVLVPPFVAGDSNPATQFWLSSRYVLAGTMLAAPFFLGRRAKFELAFVLITIPATLAILAIVWWRVFPTGYITGVGLTPFKIWSEYAVIATLAGAGALLLRRRDRTDRVVVSLTLWSIGSFIAAALFFTLYTDVAGVLNVLGHLAQLAGFLFLLAGIVRTVMSRPMALVFAELSASEARLGRANRALAMLSEARRSIADSDTEQELLTGSCKVVCETGGYRLVWVGEALHDDARTVRIAASCGEAVDYLRDLSITWDDSERGGGPTGTAIRTGKPFVCGDIAKDPRFAPWRDNAIAHGLYSSTALPIDVAGTRYGTINLYTAEAGRFGEEELALIGQLTTSIGTGIEALRVREARERSLVELNEKREQLEDVIDERTADLKAAIADLEEASRAKDQFLRSMSHELRTPLNSIIGFSTVMLQGLAGPLSEEQTAQLRMVNTSGHHLLALVSEILDLSRIEAGASDVVLSEFEVGEMVASVAGPVSVLARQSQLEFTTELPDHPITLVSDEAKIRQILLNLLGNAVKFTVKGSVRVSVDDSQPGEVSLVVSDTGFGIPPEELDRVMEEFHQVPRADGMKPEGTGLGLTIATRLADLIGGGITVSSVPGVGSVFTLTVPLRPAPDETAEAAPAG
ncbi:MAG: MASE3 domain-containing protein [Coriobacteriia bacterium]|nr:MASE3 domain-containing protein [Coriobacteriia bacterium]